MKGKGFDVLLTVVKKREEVGACGAEVDGLELGNFDGVFRSLCILHIIAYCVINRVSSELCGVPIVKRPQDLL